MPDLLCPLCGRTPESHDIPVSECKLFRLEALRAAQRKAATEHLKKLGTCFKQAIAYNNEGYLRNLRWHIIFVIHAYRAVGILGRKGGE